jgi:hypothetical protein
MLLGLCIMVEKSEGSGDVPRRGDALHGTYGRSSLGQHLN